MRPLMSYQKNTTRWSGWRSVLLGAILLIGGCGPAAVESTSAPDEALTVEERTQVELAMADARCTQCHGTEADPTARIAPSKAPALSKVGNRMSADYMRTYLTDPHGTKPGT